MAELQEVVLEFVKKNGPVLPVQVSKNINTNILFASAILSELVSEKKIFLTHQNIGGSPLYYVKGQEGKLGILYNHLENAEKEAYDLLKERRVLKDVELTPVCRVALRNIKDFAFRLDVVVNDVVEVFWKWYLVDNIEAEKFIKAILEVKLKDEKVVQTKLKVEEETLFPSTKLREDKKNREEKKKESKKEEVILEKEITKEDFFVLVEKYLLDKKIKILKSEIVRKGREVDLFVEVPSGFGTLFYYVKAMNKKTVSNGDLSLAFNKGQKEKLPVIYLSNGKLSKKTEKFIEDNFKGYLIFRNL